MKSEMIRMRHAWLNSCSVIVLLLASGCASSGPDPAPEVQTLGFLENYAQLAPGRKGQASLIYIDGHTDFSAYSAILIDPVVAWPGADGKPAVATQESATKLDEGLRRELAHEFELVDRAGDGTLRLRAALASEAGSHLVLEVEILDARSGQRVVGAVDHRQLAVAGTTSQTDAWAILIRNRLATFRQFDSAHRAREAGEAP
jgi:hypothetical protein